MFQLDNEQDDIEPHEQAPPVQPQKNALLATFENPAAMSPYRLNPSYRRPPGGDSDHGYSTMTPHEDSEHNGPVFIEPLLAGKDRHRIPTSTQSIGSSSRASSPILAQRNLHRHSMAFGNTISKVAFENTGTFGNPAAFDASGITRLPGDEVGNNMRMLAQVQVHVVDGH